MFVLNKQHYFSKSLKNLYYVGKKGSNNWKRDGWI